MPDLNPHINFVLPGWETKPLACHTCLSSLSSSYSRKWNPRNIEYPWYEPWTLILQDLVADLPALAVSPQTYLWYYRRPAPGDHRIEPPSVEDDDSFFEVGNTTVDSISSIHVRSSRNKHRLVDFAITRKVSRNRSDPEPAANTPNDPFCLSRKVDYVGIPLLCELKRSAHRTSDFCTSIEYAKANLIIASEQLIRQAFHLFEMYPHQQEVLLIAVSGFWWSYRLLFREESKMATSDEMKMAVENEEAGAEPDVHEGLADPQDGVVDEVVNPDYAARDEQNPSGLPPIYHGLNVAFQDQASKDLGLHLLLTRTNFRLCTTTWSETLLFGTPPSNQVLYLIHQHLENIVNNGYDGTKG